MIHQLDIRKLRQAVEQSASTIIITNVHGTIEYINPRFTELTGYSVAEMMGQNPSILKSGETSPETYAEMWAAITSGKTWRGEVKNKRKDGTLYWGALTVAPVADDHGVISHFIGIEEDITKRKALESQLLSANEELVRSNQELKHFTDIASHDLKAPLSTIISALNFIREEEAANLSPSGRELMQVTVNQAEKMLLLLTDLLSFTRAGAKKGTREQVDLNEIVLSVQQNLSAFMFEKGGVLEKGELPTVEGNRALLTLLFQNLIENGLKYCSGRPPVVSIAATLNQAGNEWIFSVTDNGIGFDVKEADRIFEPFTRLLTKEKFPGTGLGLATCKRIVEIFDGKIWADSEIGKGSTFYFTIPLPAPAGTPDSGLR